MILFISEKYNIQAKLSHIGMSGAGGIIINTMNIFITDHKKKEYDMMKLLLFYC